MNMWGPSDHRIWEEPFLVAVGGDQFFYCLYFSVDCTNQRPLNKLGVPKWFLKKSIKHHASKCTDQSWRETRCSTLFQSILSVCDWWSSHQRSDWSCQMGRQAPISLWGVWGNWGNGGKTLIEELFWIRRERGRVCQLEERGKKAILSTCCSQVWPMWKKFQG